MAGRPLDRIASWQNIHGVTPEHMDNYYKKLFLDTQFASYQIPSVLFSEDRYVKMMEFREKYIKRLHALLTERLPSEARVTIRIPAKPRSSIRASTYNAGKAKYDQMVADIQAKGPGALAAAAADLVPTKSLTIFIRLPKAEPGSYSLFVEDIANPVNQAPTNALNRLVGIDVSKIVFNTIEEMRDSASALLKSEVVLPYVYRPPGSMGPENAGGAAYLAAKSKFNKNRNHVGGSRRKKRSRRNRSMKRTKHYFS